MAKYKQTARPPRKGPSLIGNRGTVTIPYSYNPPGPHTPIEYPIYANKWERDLLRMLGGAGAMTRHGIRSFYNEGTGGRTGVGPNRDANRGAAGAAPSGIGGASQGLGGPPSGGSGTQNAGPNRGLSQDRRAPPVPRKAETSYAYGTMFGMPLNQQLWNMTNKNKEIVKYNIFPVINKTAYNKPEAKEPGLVVQNDNDETNDFIDAWKKYKKPTNKLFTDRVEAETDQTAQPAFIKPFTDRVPAPPSGYSPQQLNAIKESARKAELAQQQLDAIKREADLAKYKREVRDYLAATNNEDLFDAFDNIPPPRSEITDRVPGFAPPNSGYGPVGDIAPFSPRGQPTIPSGLGGSYQSLPAIQRPTPPSSYGGATQAGPPPPSSYGGAVQAFPQLMHGPTQAQPHGLGPVIGTIGAPVEKTTIKTFTDRYPGITGPTQTPTGVWSGPTQNYIGPSQPSTSQPSGPTPQSGIGGAGGYLPAMRTDAGALLPHSQPTDPLDADLQQQKRSLAAVRFAARPENDLDLHKQKQSLAAVLDVPTSVSPGVYVDPFTAYGKEIGLDLIGGPEEGSDDNTTDTDQNQQQAQASQAAQHRSQGSDHPNAEAYERLIDGIVRMLVGGAKNSEATKPDLRLALEVAEGNIRSAMRSRGFRGGGDGRGRRIPPPPLPLIPPEPPLTASDWNYINTALQSAGATPEELALVLALMNSNGQV